jgi:hypothetical protein
MVPVMRRKIALIAVLGGLATGLGCQHIGGKTDCGYNPADYPIQPVTTPYPTFPIIELPKDPVDPAKKPTGSDTDPKKADKPNGNEGGN